MDKQRAYFAEKRVTIDAALGTADRSARRSSGFESVEDWIGHHRGRIRRRYGALHPGDRVHDSVARLPNRFMWTGVFQIGRTAQWELRFCCRRSASPR